MKYSKFKKELKNEYDASFRETPKRKLSIHIKLAPVYALAASVLIFIGVLIGNSVAVGNYNKNLNKDYYAQRETFNDDWDSKELVKISSEKEIRKYTYTSGFKMSLWDTITHVKMAAAGDEKDTANVTGAVMQPEVTGSVVTNDKNTGIPDGSSYETNTQEKGIDEADIAKCDGKYIYYLKGGYLYIYNLEGNRIVCNHVSLEAKELMIYGESIILLGDHKLVIYHFDGSKVTLGFSEGFGEYVDSRMTNGFLYFVVMEDGFDEEKLTPENPVYYDGYSPLSNVYTLYRVDLTNYEVKSAGLVSGHTESIYMSDSYFVVASTVYFNGSYSLLSVFDTELNPVAVIKGVGTIKDQYCMDEQEDMLRFVLSIRNKNSISIYDLKSLKRIGFLNEGIGLESHTVRSVAFSGNACYVCTYENKDPLYEIDLSDPTNPTIVSAYEAPGYSGYLYTWVYNEKEYVLGLGYTDEFEIKISVYKKTEEGTTQIGKDFLIAGIYYTGLDYYVKDMYYSMFSEGKKLFIYTNDNHLYLGATASNNEYALFDIELLGDDATISLYNTIEIEAETRCFLIDGKFYLPQTNKLIIVEA